MPDSNATLAKLCGWTVKECQYDEDRGKFHMAYRDDIPDFLHSLDAHARYVWPVIEKRGLDEQYVASLERYSGGISFTTDPWVILRVSAEQHTRAAIAVLGGKHE